MTCAGTIVPQARTVQGRRRSQEPGGKRGARGLDRVTPPGIDSVKRFDGLQMVTVVGPVGIARHLAGGSAGLGLQRSGTERREDGGRHESEPGSLDGPLEENSAVGQWVEIHVHLLFVLLDPGEVQPYIPLRGCTPCRPAKRKALALE